MNTRNVRLTCRPHYGAEHPSATSHVLEEGTVSVGTALELVSYMLYMHWDDVAFEVTTLTTDEIVVTYEYPVRFGGEEVGKMPRDSSHGCYAFSIRRTSDLKNGLMQVCTMVEAIARAYPELCSDEVLDSLGLTEPSPTPR